MTTTKTGQNEKGLELGRDCLAGLCLRESSKAEIGTQAFRGLAHNRPCRHLWGWVQNGSLRQTMGYIVRVILGFHGDNGKEDGNIGVRV